MRLYMDLKEKGFYSIMGIGALAGLMEGTMSKGFALHYLFPGAILTISSAFVGGLCGFLIKDFFRVIRGMKPYRGVNNDAMILGGLAGTIAGTVIQVAGSPDGANLLVGAVAGSFFGSLSGAFPDEFVTPIIQLMHRAPASRTGSSETRQSVRQE
ncbi:glycine zipper family protein [Desulfovibrio oxyclinae]|uniref:glycine zipper family protein n=1 Tax=Desulfovibrio oxyclinae TaxID=63560 RepID=UPI00039D2865|nr:glycine zipper family protein [Desulfovibrio oxyclinae]